MNMEQRKSAKTALEITKLAIEQGLLNGDPKVAAEKAQSVVTFYETLAKGLESFDLEDNN